MQLVIVGFDGDVVESEVIDELFAASMSGDIKLIDMLVIDKDKEGNVYSDEISELTFEEEINYGALIGGLIGLGAGGGEGAEAGAEAGAKAVAATGSVLGITPFDVNDLVHDIPVGHSAIVVLFEHTWASHLHEATLAAGGTMLAQALIEPEGLVLLGREMEAALEAAAVIEAAQLIELEAIEEAAEAVALSEAIQEEAARRSIAALIAAEMIEEAAIEEATQVVQAALAAEEEAAGQA
jgi:uncharacterized membrane protein